MPAADELVKRIRQKGGRIYRMTEPPRVIVLTTDPELAAGLQKIGATVTHEYDRAPGGVREWDISIGQIETEGKTVWEAAG